MYRFPTIREAKTHAKHLARTLDLKITQAQEIVAYQFGCNHWSELISKVGVETQSDQTRYREMFDHLAGQDKLEQFKALIEPHLVAIRQHIDEKLHVENCTLRKIASSKYHQISGSLIQQILDDTNEQPSILDSELIKSLEFYDDTVSRILTYARHGDSNGHIEPALYGISLYAYYKFSGKSVEIISREYDLKVYRPSRNSTNSLSVCSRAWFKKYMVNYLRLMIQQLRTLGYEGTLRVCAINGVSVSDYYQGVEGYIHHDSIYELFGELLEMGGQFSWTTDTNGNKGDIGIEIPFGQIGVSFLGGAL
ncbi:hypothetical protein RUL20_002030 [Vibrio parahaemolyticus]|uniref:hypothetical protein n=1 Tax=Vibrio parahaemolyticus TaxID=670 RepID=UPI0028DA25F0|nr:hypothetical protein [Vibrio parahaemolyticus]